MDSKMSPLDEDKTIGEILSTSSPKNSWRQSTIRLQPPSMGSLKTQETNEETEEKYAAIISLRVTRPPRSRLARSVRWRLSRRPSGTVHPCRTNCAMQLRNRKHRLFVPWIRASRTSRSPSTATRAGCSVAMQGQHQALRSRISLLSSLL